MGSALRSSFLVFGLFLALFSVPLLLRQSEWIQAQNLVNRFKALGQIDNDKPVKLLILAYPRTGSSFTGEILATSENTSYVFEPLHQIKPFGYPIDVVSTWNTSVENYVENYINNLFNCDNETLTELQTHPFYFKAKNGKSN